MQSATPNPNDSSSLPAIDVSRLSYTRRDWSRWNSFDLYCHSNFVTHRRTNRIGLIETLKEGDVTAEDVYGEHFRCEMMESFFKESYRRFRRLKLGEGQCDDFIQLLKRDCILEPGKIGERLNYAMNQEYNHWRQEEQVKIREELRKGYVEKGLDMNKIDPSIIDLEISKKIDSLEFDFRSHPKCRPTIEWFHQLLDVHLNQQCLDLSSRTEKGVKQPHSNYGLWPEKDGSFIQSMVYWRSPGIGFLYGHYVQLLEDTMIRRIRQSIFAGLSAQYAFYLATSKGIDHHVESQWFLRVNGFSQSTYVLLRTEEELRQRGSWSDETDCILKTDVTTGQWTDEDILHFSEEETDRICDRIETQGQTEFNSSYHNWSYELICAQLLHAPSPRIYIRLTRILDRLRWELSAHLQPSCGMWPGPSSRSYDLFSGAHHAHDRLDYHMYFKHCFKPYADSTKEICKHYHLDSNPSSEPYLPECLQKKTLSDHLKPYCTTHPSKDLPNIQPPTGFMDQNYQRNMFNFSILAGFENLPFKYLVELQFQSPYRLIEQRFSYIPTQDRTNFLTPSLQLGYAGEDDGSGSLVILACGRLSGPPVEGAPTAQVNHGDTMVTSMIRTFPLIGSSDPFYRTAPLSVAGTGLQAWSRQLSCQYQSWMLTTSLLGPTGSMSSEMEDGPWSSNMILPIGVEKILVDGICLPFEMGTSWTIPLKSILTITHLQTSISLRLIHSTHDEGIPDAERIGPFTTPLSSLPSGFQPCALSWHVDASSILAGCGKLVVHHRHKVGSTSHQPRRKPYRVTWLWGGGTTKDDSECLALAEVLRSAKVEEKITHKGNWNEYDQPKDHYPIPYDIYCKVNVGEQQWHTAVTIGRQRPDDPHDDTGLCLSITRTDVYHPFKHDPIYRTPSKGALHRQPYFHKDVSRCINGLEIQQWSEKEEPYRFTRIEEKDLFQPHRMGGNTRVIRTPTTGHFQTIEIE